MTIVGHGDIASVLHAVDTRPGWVWFASGVSNSAETRRSEFERERNLLYKQPTDAHLVYFSSLAAFDRDTPYFIHKRVMEMRVKNIFKKHTIVRLGNITWGKNPSTLINHLRARHAAGLPLDVQPVYRYVVEQDEFLHWMKLIPDWSCEHSITGQWLTVAEIVARYVTPVTEDWITE
jgi:hypothetical protein